MDFHKFKIEEAQRRYPIGTHFLYAHLKHISNENIGIIVSDNFKLVDNDIYNLTTDGNEYNKKGIIRTFFNRRLVIIDLFILMINGLKLYKKIINI